MRSTWASRASTAPSSSDAGRPGWLHAKAKLATVAILGVMLNAYFLRSPLDARLADPAVPHMILLAWLAVEAR